MSWNMTVWEFANAISDFICNFTMEQYVFGIAVFLFVILLFSFLVIMKAS